MADQHLTLHWAEHHNALVTDMENLLESNSFVDCTIAAEGQYLKAHKIVLSACSPYFQLLFKQEGEKNPIIILKDVKYEYLQLAVDFMYRGKINVLETQLSTFLEVARSLQIRGLNNTNREPIPERAPSAPPCMSPVEPLPLVPDIVISDDDDDEMDCKVVDMINATNVNEMDALPEQQELLPIEEEQNPITCTIQSTYSMAPGADLVPRLENPVTTEDVDWPPRAPSPSLSVASSFSVKAELIEELSAGVLSDDETFPDFDVENGVTETEPVARTNSTRRPSNERYRSPETVEDTDTTVAVLNDRSSEGIQYLVTGLPSKYMNLNPMVYVKRMNVRRLQERQKVGSAGRLQENLRVVSDRELSDDSSEEIVEASQRCSGMYTVGTKKMKTSPRMVNEFTNTSAQSSRMINESTSTSSPHNSNVTSRVDVRAKSKESTSTSSQPISNMTSRVDVRDKSRESTNSSSQLNSNVTSRVDVRAKSKESTSTSSQPISNMTSRVDVREKSKASTSSSSQHNSNVTSRVDVREKSKASTSTSSQNNSNVISRVDVREKSKETSLRTSSATSKATPSVSSTTETTPQTGPKRKRNYTRRHSCPDCSRKFVRPNELAVHRRRHTGERPYTCPTCHKCFAQSSDLKRHSRVHTGEQPYACKYCGKSFGRSSSLKIHMRLHTGEQPYQCTHCEKKFVAHSQLWSHRRVHMEGSYKCAICGLDFKRKNQMVMHWQDHHNSSQ